MKEDQKKNYEELAEELIKEFPTKIFLYGVKKNGLTLIIKRDPEKIINKK
jgi:hypothetical protein